MKSFCNSFFLFIIFNLNVLKVVFAQEESTFKFAEFMTMLKIPNGSFFPNKYPNLTLMGDVPYFHKDYTVNLFYNLTSNTLGASYSDTVTNCLTGIGLRGFFPKSKATDKSILYQTTDKQRLLSLEEELIISSGYKLEKIEQSKDFYIKKYMKNKSRVDIILYGLKKRQEMGNCFRVFFYSL